MQESVMFPDLTEREENKRRQNDKQISETIEHPEMRAFLKGNDCSISAEKILNFIHRWSYHDFVFEKLGEGFFGTVYKVFHKTTNQVLVLKELKTSSDEDHKAMFIDEIKTLSRLSHPNVLKCRGMAMHGDNLCLLTEYIDGGSLDEMLVNRHFSISNWEAKLNISMDIALGMAYLHSVGVIHRDLKSKNILIKQLMDGRLQGIIADFGLSYTINNSIVSEEEFVLDTVGSPYHMAPEVLNHKPYNMKADVFSYGIILCEMITMCPGADPDDLPRSNDFGLAIADFFEMASDCPSKFLDLTVRCCQVNPKDRPKFANIVNALDKIRVEVRGNGEPKVTGLVESEFYCKCNNDGTRSDECLDETKELISSKASSNNDTDDLLKQSVGKCSLCEGKIAFFQEAMQLQAKANDSNDSVTIQDNHAMRKNDDQASSSFVDELTSSKAVNESNEMFTEQITQLAKNTPGKLPRFFQHLLRSKLSRIRPKDVKRRWRKSLHDIFSLQGNNHDVKTVNSANTAEINSPECVSQDSSATDKQLGMSCKLSASDVKKVKGSNKCDKNRRDSRHRRKSSQKNGLEIEIMNLNQTGRELKEEQARKGSDVDSCLLCDSLDSCHSPSIKHLNRSLAVSVDSLDRMSLSDDHRNRRNSMPSRKARHGRTQSGDGSKPPLRKQSSGSSKILNFLRRKSQTSPRD